MPNQTTEQNTQLLMKALEQMKVLEDHLMMSPHPDHDFLVRHCEMLLSYFIYARESARTGQAPLDPSLWIDRQINDKLSASR